MSKPVIQWIRPEIRALSAYHVPPASGMLKLDAMENPYHWPESLVDEWLSTLRHVHINRYPDPHAHELKQDLSLLMGVDPAFKVLLGNGSDELIQIIAMAVSGPDRTILAPEPSFAMYKMIATFCGMQYQGVPLGNDFALDMPAMLEAIEQYDPAVLFLAQPNNPTGNLFELAQVEQLCEAANGIVVIDEAYLAFTDRHHLDLMSRYDNVVILRTLSKMGLAGLRLGMLFGSAALLNEFEKVRLPYNINVLTEASTRFALTHFEVLKAQTQDIRANRAELYQALQTLPFETVWPSEANFILVRTASGQAKSIFSRLKDEQILVKCLDGAHPQLQDCLRFTVGKREENRLLLQSLKHIMAG